MSFAALQRDVGRTILSVLRETDRIVRPTGRSARWIAALLVFVWMASVSVRDVVGQSALHDLFKQVERQAAAAGQQENEGAGPFADDPQPDAPRIDVNPRKPEVPAADTAWPPKRIEGMLPLAGSNAAGDVQLTPSKNGLISLVVRDASLSKVLALLAQTQNLNIVASNDIDALISITLRDVPLEEALTAILSVANYTWVQRNNIILITSLTDASNLPPDVQGRQIQVFDLDYASSLVVAEAVTGFLSPIGKVTTTQTVPTDNRRTREMVIVEDLPESLARIAAYICQVDRPPRQVLIQAHVLQVNLDDTNKQGVNIDALLRCVNADISLETRGFANPAAPQAFLATINGTDLDSVIELIQTTTDTTTLGSPKLLVLNEQEARLQVGEQLGFRVTTTTETSSLESVQFLDVGVVLTMRPRITRDGRVLLHVKPEVSKGQVNPETGLPQEETTQLETDVMLRDGQGMVIGGLIKEADSTTQQKVPYLGDVKGLGWFFRRSEVVKERAEIIIALMPRVQPYNAEYQAFEQGELVKAGVPLFEGPLCRTERPWDPILPDGKRVYRPLIPRKNVYRGPGPNSEYIIPPEPLPQQDFYGQSCGPPLRQFGPFLSDEALPMPALGEPGPDQVEIITDRE